MITALIFLLCGYTCQLAHYLPDEEQGMLLVLALIFNGAGLVALLWSMIV